MQYSLSFYAFDDKLNQALRLSCDYESPELNLTLLEGCSFPSVVHVKIELCPVFQEPLARVLEKMGVTPGNVRHLVWETSHTLRDGLQSWHLSGLSNLTSLQMFHNEFSSIPNSFLEHTPLLEKVYINGNFLEELPDDILSYTPDVKLLDLGSNKVHSLPETLFQNVPSIEVLNLWKNDISSIPPRLFSNNRVLNTVVLSSNKLTAIDAQLFADMNVLHTLDIQINELSTLPENAFKGCANLTTVSLQFNKIKTLPPNLFEGTSVTVLNLGYNELTNLTTSLNNLPSLQNITLHKNSLSGLDANIFEGSPNVVKLDLQANSIRVLAEDIFNHLTQLKIILLNSNNLEELPSGLFRNCISLLRVFLQKNNLKEIPIDTFPTHESIKYSSSGIVKLDLSDNRLTLEDSLALNQLTSLEELYLANNLVTSVLSDALDIFTRLKILDLRNNSLTSLSDRDLSFMSQNVTLLLQDNSIARVSTTKSLGFGSSDKYISVFLGGNPLNCDCVMYSFLTTAQMIPPFPLNRPFNLIVKDARQAFCAQPENFMDVSLSEVDASKLVCEYSCSFECPCDIRQHDYFILMDCSGLGLHHAPTFTEKYDRVKKHYKLSLDLSNNLYENVSFLIEPEFENLVNLDLSNNTVSELNETYLPLQLRYMDLSFNNFTTMSQEFVDYLNGTGMTLHLGSNPWSCDCELKSFHEFLRNNYELVRDRQQVVCAEGEHPIDELTTEDLCSFYHRPAALASIVVCTFVLILVAVLVTAAWFRHKEMVKVWLYSHNLCLWAVTEQEIDADKKYDAFISYSYKDEGFVNDILVPGLESGDPKYRVCLHYRDWIPGEYIQEQILSSVRASRRTIVVLSKNFIESVWGQLEFKAAHSQALKDKTNRIIVVVYGDVPSSEDLDGELKLYVSTNTYLQWGDQRFWERLRYAMPHAKYHPYKKSKVDKLELVKPAPLSATKTLED
ncbi:Leucine rich repeat 5 [Trinorchestia longiramus]|nr:Leucine rich repeat 5 [Trinorchestia longiramus]